MDLAPESWNYVGLVQIPAISGENPVLLILQTVSETSYINHQDFLLMYGRMVRISPVEIKTVNGLTQKLISP